MSSPLRPLADLPHFTRAHNDMADFTLPPLSSWSPQYRPREPFSSPPQSSSPPRTPYNSKHSYDYAHIRSSPQLGPGMNFTPRSECFEDSHGVWPRLAVPPMHLKSQAHPSTSLMARSTFIHKPRYNAASDLDASEYSLNMDTDFDDVRSDLSVRRASLHPASPPLSPTPDDGDDNTGFSFSELGIHTMCYRTSSERGRWKTDPMPYQLQKQKTQQSARKSAPASEATSEIQITSRPISEPAPSVPIPSIASTIFSATERCESNVPVPEVTTSAPTPLDCDDDEIHITLPLPSTSSLPSSPNLESMEPLPPLTSDRDSSMDAEDLMTPSSPLPPSSPPPPFSPALSLAGGQGVQLLHRDRDAPSSPSNSSSPGYSRHSSSNSNSPSPLRRLSLPIVAPSSPLSPISSDIEDGELEIDDVDRVGEDENTVLTSSSQTHIRGGVVTHDTSDLDLNTPTPRDHSTATTCATSSSTLQSTDKPDQQVPQEDNDIQMTPGIRCPSLKPSGEESPAPVCTLQHDDFPPPASATTSNSKSDLEPTPRLPSPPPVAVSVASQKRPISPHSDSNAKSTTSLTVGSGASDDETDVEGPARKRLKVSVSGSSFENDVSGASSSSAPLSKLDNLNSSYPSPPVTASPSSSMSPSFSTALSSAVASTTKQEQEQKTKPKPQQRRRRKPKYVVEESESESDSDSASSSSTSTSSSTHPSSRRNPKPKSKSSKKHHPPSPPKLTFPNDGISRDQNGVPLADSEICGMIIEGMATSRASSLPISQIYKIVMQSRPAMRNEKCEREWYGEFGRVLSAGTGVASGGFGSGVFGKVDSSYKDNNDPAVEARWFYVPEMDCDHERAALIRSMMPRPGKRSVTKKYKQYYYQPLDKISRWDPEDDL